MIISASPLRREERKEEVSLTITGSTSPLLSLFFGKVPTMTEHLSGKGAAASSRYLVRSVLTGIASESRSHCLGSVDVVDPNLACYYDVMVKTTSSSFDSAKEGPRG